MMNTSLSHFNRNLLIIFLFLCLLTIAALTYGLKVNVPEDMQGWMMLSNMLTLSIPVVLIYGSIYLLVAGGRERATLGHVSPLLARLLRWAPRIAAMLIAFFIALFSLDVFDTPAAPLDLLGAFLLHNIPAIALILLLVIAWRYPAVGFVAFLIFAILFAFMFTRGFYLLQNVALFVLPILLIAFLFYADWKWLASNNK